MNFDPELLKERGMVLASEGERKGNRVRKEAVDEFDCNLCVSVCVVLTYEGLFGDDVLCHLKKKHRNNTHVTKDYVNTFFCKVSYYNFL